jgi:hypothetical protein
MAFNVKYRCEFDTILGRSVKVDIEQDGTFTITKLTAFGESPLFIEYPNAEFDKLAGIRESRLRFTILGGDSAGVEALDFVTTSDTQYKIKVYIEDTLEWVGWLDNDKLFQPFQDGNYEITLSANDGLALLKNIELADLSDNQVWDIKQAKEFINYCLDKTELGLNWWSFINMYPILVSGGSVFDVSQRGVDPDLDAFYFSNFTSFTFITGPRTFEDSYTVLSKIMEAFACTLFQARGKWYILHLNDRIAGDLDGSERDATGAALGIASNQSFSFDTGILENFKFANEDAVISWEKLYKSAKLLFEFKDPPVFFRNWDLQDGVINIPLSTTARSVYDISNWTETVGNSYIGVETNTVTGAEQLRYLLQFPVVTYSDSTVQPAVKTNNYWISEGDKVLFSYLTREKNTGFVNTAQFNYIILTDGSSTYYLDDDGKWYTAIKAIGYSWGASENRQAWKKFSIESESVPISGNISVTLTAIGNSRTASNEVRYRDLSFSIQHKEDTRKGMEHGESQTGVIKNEYDNQLYLCTHDDVSVQGAITNPNHVKYEGFKYYSEDKANNVPFIKFINRVYWKALYRNFIRLEGTIFNIYDGRLLSPLNTFTNTGLPDKEFMITTMNTDIRNEFTEVRAVELRDTSSTDDFDEVGDESFRYIIDKEEVFNEIPEDKKPLDSKFGLIGTVINLISRRKKRRFNNFG